MTYAIFIGIVLLSIIVGFYRSNGAWLTFFGLTALWGVVAVIDDATSPESIAQRKADAAQQIAQRRANETPHVVREADGCKVYAFLSGDRYHYFTRCPDSRTTTDRSWDECHSEMVGKVSTRKCVTKSESIEVTR